MSANVVNDACISMVSSRLPRALVKTQVMTIVRPVIITTNMAMSATVGGVQTPDQDRGGYVATIARVRGL